MIKENDDLDLDVYEDAVESIHEDDNNDSVEEPPVDAAPKEAAVPTETVDNDQAPSEATADSGPTRGKAKTKKNNATQEPTRVKLSKTEMLARQREQSLNPTIGLDEDSGSPGPARKGNKKGKRSLGLNSGSATPLSMEVVGEQATQADLIGGEEESVGDSSSAVPNESSMSKKDKRKAKEATKSSQLTSLVSLRKTSVSVLQGKHRFATYANPSSTLAQSYSTI